MSLLDSGKRRDFDTGSVRDVRSGKGRYDLLPGHAIDALAKHFEKGSEKYGERNWELGQPLSVFIDSALRHIFKWMMGRTDEDHLVAAAWNVMCALDTRCRILNGQLPVKLQDLPAQSVVKSPGSTTDDCASYVDDPRCESMLHVAAPTPTSESPRDCDTTEHPTGRHLSSPRRTPLVPSAGFPTSFLPGSLPKAEPRGWGDPIYGRGYRSTMLTPLTGRGTSGHSATTATRCGTPASSPTRKSFARRTDSGPPNTQTAS